MVTISSILEKVCHERKNQPYSLTNLSSKSILMDLNLIPLLGLEGNKVIPVSDLSLLLRLLMKIRLDSLNTKT